MKKIIPFTITLLFIMGFINCENKDFSKEANYISEKYDYDTSSVVNIVKAERIKAYNPKLDENFQNLIVFGKTTLKNIVEAIESYDKGDIKVDDLYNVFKESFSSSQKSNTDATVVKYRINDDDNYYVDVLFSNDGVYYATFVDIGLYVSDKIYENDVKEAGEKLKRELRNLE